MNLRDRVFRNTIVYPVIFAVLTAVVIIVFQVMNLKTIERENRNKAESVEMIYRDAGASVRSYAAMLASYVDIQRGAATDKRHFVSGVTTPIFDNIDVSFLTVHDADGYVLARGHNSDIFGEEQAGLPHVKTALNGNRADMIAEAEGGLALLSASPIYFNDELAGCVTVGQFLDDDFASRLSGLVGAEIIIAHEGHTIASSFNTAESKPGATAMQTADIDTKETVDAGGSADDQQDGTTTGSPADANPEHPARAETVSLPPEMNPGMRKINVGGRRYDLSYVPIQQGETGETGIFIATDNTTVRRALLALMLVCTAFVGIALFGMFRRLGSFTDDLTMPIMHTARLADRVAGGELDVEPLDVTTDDETGRLMKSFNVMVENLREMNRKEKEQRDYLEGQVRRLVTVIDTASQGDFSARFNVDNDDEFGRIGRALNKMIEDLDSLIATDTARREYLETKISELLEIISAASQGDFTRYYQGREDDEIGRLGIALSEMIVDLHSMIEHNNSRRTRLEQQVSDLLCVIEAAGEGDFTKRFEVKRDDQIGRVGRAMNKMIEDLNVMITEIEDMKAREAEQKEQLEGQVREILRVVEAASGGDLTVKLSIEGDEGIITDLKDHLNRMFERLQLIVAKVRESADAVQRTGREIASITEKLRDGAAHQAGAVEKTASFGDRAAEAMDSMADSSESVLKLSRETNEGAARSGETISSAVSGMDQVGEAMEDIEAVMGDLQTSAVEIDEIVKVIDEISDQTNLLALNASIEAARAGEYGRGFSVVAREISSLAQKSVESTREITQIVRRIQKRVEKATSSTDQGRRRVSEGVELADQAGKALDSIVGSVDHVTTLIQDTTASIEKRREDSVQIRTLLKEILDITDESTRLAERTGNAVESLNRLAGELEQFVGQIKIESEYSSDE